MIDIDVRGIDELKAFMLQFPDQAMKVIDDEQWKLVLGIRNDILKSMRNTHRVGAKRINSIFSKNSKGLSIRKKAIFHQPSAPGFPPAIMTGNLANKIIPERGQGYARLYTDNVEYAAYLENGTNKMQARPFFEVAVERSDWQQKIKNRILAESFAGRRLSE